MVLRKQHLYLLAALAVLAVAYYAQRTENVRRDNEDRAKTTSACRRTAERDAYIAGGFRVLSERVGRRDNPGDQKSSEQYSAVAFSVAEALLRPKGNTDPTKLAEVEFVEGVNGKVRYMLTDSSRALIAAGCEQAFGS